MTENGLPDEKPDGKTAAALALAQGRATDEAGTAGGVSGRTVRRWLAQDPDFRRDVSRLRGELLDRAIGYLAAASVDAVTTLHQSLKAEAEPVRVRAATAILSSNVTLRESVDLERRIIELETAAQENR